MPNIELIGFTHVHAHEIEELIRRHAPKWKFKFLADIVTTINFGSESSNLRGKRRPFVRILATEKTEADGILMMLDGLNKPLDVEVVMLHQFVCIVKWHGRKKLNKTKLRK